MFIGLLSDLSCRYVLYCSLSSLLFFLEVLSWFTVAFCAQDGPLLDVDVIADTPCQEFIMGAAIKVAEDVRHTFLDVDVIAEAPCQDLIAVEAITVAGGGSISAAQEEC